MHVVSRAVLGVAALAGVVAFGTPAQAYLTSFPTPGKCVSAKIKTEGKAAAAYTGCYSKAASKGRPVDVDASPLLGPPVRDHQIAQLDDAIARDSDDTGHSLPVEGRPREAR